MFAKYLIPIVLLVGVILFSSIANPILSGMENFENKSQEMPNGNTPLICPGCKGKGVCICNQSDKTTSLSSTDPVTSTTPTNVVTPGLIDPTLQGKHPMPYTDLVDIVKKNEEDEERQTKHIEDIRKVLANTITSLEKDDVLPSGSHCSCANAPVIDPLTGEADITNGCKPPGWLRMMNSRNARDEECHS